MPKLPTATIGKATSERPPTSTGPSATIGQASAQGAIPLLAPRRPADRVTLAQVLEAPVETPDLVITELTGESRKITLRGRALPYRGSMKLTSMMRIEEGEYNGYPRLSQTVLGAKELPTEMSGCWKDRFISGGGAVASATVELAQARTDPELGDVVEVGSLGLRSARDLCDLFEDLLYCARPLRMQWAHHRRIGRLEQFEQNWLNLHDVEWKMSFRWIGRDEKIGFPAPKQSTLVDLANSFASAYTEVHAATNFDSLQAELEPSFADAVDALVGQLQRSVIDANDAIQTRASSVTGPIEALRRGATIAAFARDQAQALIEDLSATVPPAMLLAPSAPTPGEPTGLVDMSGVDAGRSIAAGCQRQAAIRSARRMRHVAGRQLLSALKSMDADAVAAVTMRDGEDLRDLSLRWYGSAGDAEKIRKFNSLPSYSPPAGTLVFLPEERAR